LEFSKESSGKLKIGRRNRFAIGNINLHDFIAANHLPLSFRRRILM
jgi:hypothetical protein